MEVGLTLRVKKDKDQKAAGGVVNETLWQIRNKITAHKETTTKLAQESIAI